jgi:hypothetical protein
MSKKNLFKLDETEIKKDTEDKEVSSVSSIICKNSGSLSFLDEFLKFLPTPEEEMEENQRDEAFLKEKIKELNDTLTIIEEKMIANGEENIKELRSKWDMIESVLEMYETELENVKIHKKSIQYFMNEEDEEFENQLPEVILSSIFSTQKKMKDVDVTIDIIKTVKEKRIEECIYCEKILKDDKGRKTSKTHFHFNSEINKKFMYSKPVLCIDCAQNILKEDSPKFTEEDIDNSDDCCKKGNKIFSSILDKDYPELNPYFQNFQNKEKEKYIKSLRKSDEKIIL